MFNPLYVAEPVNVVVVVLTNAPLNVEIPVNTEAPVKVLTPNTPNVPATLRLPVMATLGHTLLANQCCVSSPYHQHCAIKCALQGR